MTKAPTKKAPPKKAPPKKARKKPSSRRRRSWRPGLVVGAALTLSALLIVLIPVATAHDPVVLCAEDPASFPESGIAGWNGEQLENAAVIIRTASGHGFPRDGQILGVMTAMGESSLRNIDYGDWETSGVTNPDGQRTSSIGLFQQQEWWGSVETRMDPAGAASLFYTRLARLPDWQSMEPTLAIHRVQINTDPQHYARFQTDATAIVEALSGPCQA
ncbi:hypothetical protein ACW5CM_09570 [Microbacterium sp. A588]